MAVQEQRELLKQIQVKIACFFGQILFFLNSHIMTFKNVNHPDNSEKNYVFACLHSQQCGIYSILNRPPPLRCGWARAPCRGRWPAGRPTPPCRAGNPAGPRRRA